MHFYFPAEKRPHVRDAIMNLRLSPGSTTFWRHSEMIYACGVWSTGEIATPHPTTWLAHLLLQVCLADLPLTQSILFLFSCPIIFLLFLEGLPRTAGKTSPPSDTPPSVNLSLNWGFVFKELQVPFYGVGYDQHEREACTLASLTRNSRVLFFCGFATAQWSWQGMGTS